MDVLTGLALIEGDCEQNHLEEHICVPFRVVFRDLIAVEIENYRLADKPYDCAAASSQNRSASPCSITCRAMILAL